MPQGVSPRSALQVVSDELDTARRHLKAALTRQAQLEQRLKSLEGQIRRAKERADAWKTVAERETAARKARRASRRVPV